MKSCPRTWPETGMRAVRETLEHGRSTGHQYTLEVQDNVNRFEIFRVTQAGQ